MRRPELTPRINPKQTRGKLRKEQILDVTEKLALDIGYDSITTNVIAEHAGIPIGTLYHYYSNKFAIFADIVKRSFSELEHKWQEQMTDNPARESIGDYYSRILEMMSEHWKDRKAAMMLWSISRNTPEMQPVTESHFKLTTERNTKTVTHYYPSLSKARCKIIGTIMDEAGTAMLNRLNNYRGKQREEIKREMILMIRLYLESIGS